MQQVVKVSIGNTAFTLDKDAHGLMQDYLDRLTAHYADNTNCGEILSEIESRIAELLIEKGYRDNVVPADAIQNVINILGRPEDFDGENDNESRKTIKKRVYRDPENKIVGGVCGGLGAYFSTDPLIFRIIFAVWVLFFFWLRIFEDWGWGMSVLGMLAYVALWIAIPEARTVEQKYNMKGGSVSLKDIQRNMEREARDVSHRVSKGVRDGVRSTGGFWKALGRCVAICIGALLFLIGMSGSITALLALFGIGIWDSLSAFGISSLFSVMTDSPAWVSVLISVLACIVVVLPFIGMLYAGILLLFRLRAPRWRPGLIMFIVWAISLLGMIAVSLSSITTVRSIDDRTTNAQLPALDTLFVEFAGCSQWKDSDVLIDAGRRSFELMYKDDNSGSPLLVIYPKFYLERNSDTVGHIRANTEYVTEGMTLNDINEKKSRDFWSFDEQSRTLRLEPIVFSSDIRVTDMRRDLRLTINEKTRVIVREPVHHEFDSDTDFCSSRFLKMISEM